MSRRHARAFAGAPMRKRVLPILALLLSAAPPARAAGFATAVLDAGEDTVRAVRARDLTGDGRPEIVAFADGPRGGAVHVFPATGGGALAVLRPAEAGCRDVFYAFAAKTRPDGPAEIVVVDLAKGVAAFALEAAEGGAAAGHRFGAPRVLAEAPALPFPPDPSRLTVLDAEVDLDGDGVEECVLPGADGYRIIASGRAPRHLPLPVPPALEYSAHRSLLLAFAIPRLKPLDLDGDGRTDLAGGLPGEIHVFAQGPDGAFAASRLPFPALAPRPPDEERASAALEDVDGDGKADLLLTQTPARVGLFERFTSQHSLFLGPALFDADGSGRLATPASSFKVDGLSVNPALFDFDGDGDRDLVVTSLGVDMQSRLMKRVMADYMVFRYDAEARGFERQPLFRVSRPFPIAQLEANSTAPVCFLSGDFDGDGARDLLDTADGGHITILAGTSDTGFLSADRYGFRQEIFRARAEVGNDVRIGDLDGDGADDLLAWRGGLVYLVRSQR